MNLIENVNLFQSLNDPNMDCRNASHYCVAALQQKQQPHLIQENLRDQPAKKILLNFQITYVLNRPKIYIGESKTHF